MLQSPKHICGQSVRKGPIYPRLNVTIVAVTMGRFSNSEFAYVRHFQLILRCGEATVPYFPTYITRNNYTNMLGRPARNSNVLN